MHDRCNINDAARLVILDATEEIDVIADHIAGHISRHDDGPGTDILLLPMRALWARVKALNAEIMNIAGDPGGYPLGEAYEVVNYRPMPEPPKRKRAPRKPATPPVRVGMHLVDSASR